MLYMLYKVSELLVNILPLKIVYGLACIIGDLKYYTSIRDKRIIISNLKRALGKDNGEIHAKTRTVFRNFCKYLVDFIRIYRVDKAYIKKYIKIKGIEYLEEAFKKKKGVIILGAHLGNWELGAAVVGLLGYPLNVIALSHKDKRINNFFDNRRKSKGVKVIPLGGSVKKIFSCLEKNEAVAFLSDRDFSKSDLVVKLFGKEAIVPKGVGIFGLKKDSPIIPCFMIMEQDNTYSLIFDKPVEYQLCGNQIDDIKNIIQKSIRVIEDYIRRYPEQWFMFSDPWLISKES